MPPPTVTARRYNLRWSPPSTRGALSSRSGLGHRLAPRCTLCVCVCCQLAFGTDRGASVAVRCLSWVSCVGIGTRSLAFGVAKRAASAVAMDGPENLNNPFNSVPFQNTRYATRIAAADGGAHGLTNRAADTPAAHSREHAPADSSPSPVLASDAVASLTTTDTQTRQDLSASNSAP